VVRQRCVRKGGASSRPDGIVVGKFEAFVTSIQDEVEEESECGERAKKLGVERGLHREHGVKTEGKASAQLNERVANLNLELSPRASQLFDFGARESAFRFRRA
jgi:hypothetical protein